MVFVFRRALGVALAVLFLGAPLSAHAQLTTEAAIAQLDSSNEGELQAAIEAIGLSGAHEAVRPLADRIRRGLSPDLLGMAVDTLTVLGQPSAGPVLIELLSHRRADIRLRAVQALAVCHPSDAATALAGVLSDGDASVRSAAATALGEVGGASALDALFRAFEHGITESGAAIARLANAEAARRVLGYLGHEPFTTLRPMLLAMLVRTDLDRRARLDIVARIGELATADARGLLEEVVSSGDLPSTDAVYRAANETAARISD